MRSTRWRAETDGRKRRTDCPRIPGTGMWTVRLSGPGAPTEAKASSRTGLQQRAQGATGCRFKCCNHSHGVYVKWGKFCVHIRKHAVHTKRGRFMYTFGRQRTRRRTAGLETWADAQYARGRRKRFRKTYEYEKATAHRRSQDVR